MEISIVLEAMSGYSLEESVNFFIIFVYDMQLFMQLNNVNITSMVLCRVRGGL